MRFMMFMIPKVYQRTGSGKAGADFMPNKEAVEKMTKYNEELAKSGTLITLDGLHPPTAGVRISFKSGKPNVKNGPFTDSKDVLGGYWMIQVKSREDAIDWAKRVPAENGDIIEVRQVFEMSEFPSDVQKAAESSVVVEQIRKVS